MAKEDTKFEVEGKIVGIEKTGFNVELDTGNIVFCYPSGKIRKFNINITLGDRVICELSAYDLRKGRITKRL